MHGSNPSWGYGGREKRYGKRSSGDWEGGSGVSKMEAQYWVTKEALCRRLGRKEDVHIVASDAQLDAKLDLFQSIHESCAHLQRIIDKYQERICILAEEENNVGRFLKEAGKEDKTEAGGIMSSVGSTFSHSAQHRIAIRLPLVRLYQEVETFRERAIEDTRRTVEGMEKARTEYRASLAWMKDLSQQLDPDTYKQLDKFRKVQEHVKKSKARFDRCKLDCLQKIDLLAAARCNMFSHALITYHNTISDFANNSAKAFSSLSSSFSKHLEYEWNVVKELSQVKPLEPAQEQPSSTDTSQDDKLLDFEEVESEGGESEVKGGGEVLTGLLISEESVGVPSTQNHSHYLPSHLLINSLTSNVSDPKPGTTSDQNEIEKGGCKKSWLELFSELDPLANPDSIGQSQDLDPLRNC